MKSKIITAALAGSIFLGMGLKPATASGVIPELVVQVPENVFSPKGFDDNDNSQVILSGVFENTCFKVGPVQARVDEQAKQIVIRNTAYYYPTGWCLFVQVPYLQTVDLGVISPGKYSVVLEDGRGARKPMAVLPIRESVSGSPDDALYAPIQDAFIENPALKGAPTLVLRGAFSNTCLEIKAVKVNYTEGRVAEVLPFVELGTESDCKNQPKPFEIKVVLDKLPQGKSLIHVRSMNGQSLNQVVEHR